MNIGEKVNINKKTKNIFADKATLILREMLKQPDRKWVVRDFVNSLPISLGMAGEVISAMEKLGYVEREKRGASSFTILTNKERLIRDWTQAYRFDRNEVTLFYNPDLNLNQVSRFFEQRRLQDKYALTVHAGANLETSYVKTDCIHLYIDQNIFDQILLDVRQQLNLKQLVQGGNVYLVRPYYKNSIFWGAKKHGAVQVVSNLQLYLDLYHFHPRGLQHAEYFKSQIEQKGESLA